MFNCNLMVRFWFSSEGREYWWYRDQTITIPTDALGIFQYYIGEQSMPDWPPRRSYWLPDVSRPCTWQYTQPT